MEVLKEEAQSQLVDPFKLHSDNMQRANNFNLHLPARMLFKTHDVAADDDDVRYLGGLVALQDFQVMSEKPHEAAKRIFQSTGLKPLQQPGYKTLFLTQEPVNDEQRR